MQTYDENSTAEAFRPTREQIYEFVRSQVLGVISTLDNDGAPMNATVAFSVTEDAKLIVGTSETSHKSQNIDGDSRVAVVITDVEKRYTLQVQGTARKVTQETFEAQYADEHYGQRPQSLPFKDKPGQCHILITPTHMRFSDCSTNPWAITEY
jgi:pyridoxine/pyridoxamine 5'-phosphate oxidase